MQSEISETQIANIVHAREKKSMSGKKGYMPLE